MAQEQVKIEDVEAFIVDPRVFDSMMAILNELPSKTTRVLLNEMEKTTRIIKKKKAEPDVANGGDVTDNGNGNV